MKKLLAFLLVFVLLMASSVSAEQEIKFRGIEWMGGLRDTISAVVGDDYMIMLPGGDTIGDKSARGRIYVFQTPINTQMGDREERRNCLIAMVNGEDLGDVAGLPLTRANLYFLYDESDADYIGSADDAKFFMAEYQFDASKDSFDILEKKLASVYGSYKQIDVPSLGALKLPENLRSKMEPVGTAWVALTGGVQITMYADNPMITYWYDYSFTESDLDTTGL